MHLVQQDATACRCRVSWRATRRLPRHLQPVACSPAPSDATSPLAASFRALLHACGGTSEECYVQGVLQVGPARRVLKAATAAGAAPLASVAPNLLAALGVAASQALGAKPCPLPWVGSPGEGGDGVAGAARRLIDHHVHGVAAPLPRLLDAGLLLMAFSLAETEQSLPSGDGAAVALAACESLASALAGGRALQAGLGAAGPAVTRLLSAAPAKSEYAQRAEQQEEFRALAAVKAEQSEKNAEAAARRRVARGDWKCPKCGTVNFPDRRVCYMCFEEQPEAAPKPVAAKPAAAKGGARGGASKSGGQQQRPQGKTSRPR